MRSVHDLLKVVNCFRLLLLTNIFSDKYLEILLCVDGSDLRRLETIFLEGQDKLRCRL